MTPDSSIPIKRLGLMVHPLQSTAESAVKRFTTAVGKYDIEIIDLNENPDSLTAENCQAVASIGGDGTLLSAVRSAYPIDIPVWGINVGDLGYLTTSSLDEIETGVERIVAGDYWVERRSMIEAFITGDSEEEIRLVALNDIVVHRRVPGGGLMALDAELDGRFLATYEADGLIISTPTGSTGYNLATGGSILSPTLKAFIITPISAHSFSARSLVVDDSSVLVIKPRLKMPGENAYATADGQEVAELQNCQLRSNCSDDPCCTITVKKAERQAGLLRFDEYIFSDVLRDKLGWAEGSPVNRIK